MTHAPVDGEVAVPRELLVRAREWIADASRPMDYRRQAAVWATLLQSLDDAIAASPPTPRMEVTGTPIVLVETNRATGRMEGVGLFTDMDKARYHASKNICARNHFSVWTPNLDDTISAPSISGLTMPPPTTHGK